MTTKTLEQIVGDALDRMRSMITTKEFDSLRADTLQAVRQYAAGVLSKEMHNFLTGSGPLEGVHFGEKHPTRTGLYWWRKLLPQPAEHQHAAGEFCAPHETLRAALLNCGIAGPESNEELGADMDRYARLIIESAARSIQPAERPNGAPDTAPMYKALIEAKIALSVVNSGASIHVISLIDAVLNAAPTQSTQQPDATVYVDAGDLRQVLNGNDMPASMSAEPQPGMVALRGAQRPDAGGPVLIYQARQYIHPEGRWVDTNRAEYDLFGDMPDRIERRIVYTNPVPQAEVAQTGTIESGLLVTMTITVSRTGLAVSDVQTHDNSYSDVAVGLAAVRDEINRVFAERKNCPYYPRNSEDAHRKIMRGAPVPAPQVAKVAESEYYAELKATLQGLHSLMESISAIEHRVGPIGSHARGYTHKITAALRHLDAMNAAPPHSPIADSGDAIDSWMGDATDSYEEFCAAYRRNDPNNCIRIAFKAGMRAALAAQPKADSGVAE